ncbi:quinone oxidoreductase-like protein 2 homolog [Strongylocentrotus purpuratus]|uniref:Enoyl reductase (ER) domain-containing protein n=1 Tax=Strongylocentrotus purpuratus TaxID=7668 RepID=A0A7M7HHX6_STRPU|nr:quinone oxidoreductase-like protein 2 homolog [Strongylocentrotus purpuratus]
MSRDTDPTVALHSHRVSLLAQRFLKMSAFRCPPEVALRSAIRLASSFHPRPAFNRGQALLSRQTSAVGQLQMKDASGASSQGRRWYRAALCTELGKPLTVGTLPSVEKVGPGKVKIAVHSVGINFGDLLMLVGQYQEKPPLPFSPGSEGAGVVMEVGEGVKSVKKGDHVVALSSRAGAMAEELITNEGEVWPIPNSLSFNDAAAIPCSFGTAWLALTRKVNLQPGETLLVTAAAGGVGLAAVELATNALDAKVIGAAGGPEKCDLVRSKGAVECIDYTTENIRDRTKELTDGNGVNVALDAVGGDVWKQCLKSLAWEGRAVVIGFASGEIPKIPANHLLLKSLTTTGLYWGRYGLMDHPVFKKSVTDCFDLYTQGKIKPHVCQTFSLEKINEAFMYMKNRKSTGKIIVNVR